MQKIKLSILFCYPVLYPPFGTCQKQEHSLYYPGSESASFCPLPISDYLQVFLSILWEISLYPSLLAGMLGILSSASCESWPDLHSMSVVVPSIELFPIYLSSHLLFICFSSIRL